MIINLHGKLAEAMGRKVWDLKVKSVSEALRGIEANTGKLFHHLVDSHGKDIGYEVIIDGESCENPQELQMEGRINEVDIIPHIQVAEGVGKIIAGIILLIVAWYVILPAIGAGAGLVTGSGIGAFGTGATTGGLFGGAIGVGATAFIGGAMFKIGIALILGGLYEAIIGTPESQSLELEESKGSFIFSGPVNQVRQGNPVPLAYGEVICGSQVIDVSVKNYPYNGYSLVDGSPSSPWRESALKLVNLNIDQWGYDNSSDPTIFKISQDASFIHPYSVVDPNLEIFE
jgi:predicted phage tail protein